MCCEWQAEHGSEGCGLRISDPDTSVVGAACAQSSSTNSRWTSKHPLKHIKAVKTDRQLTWKLAIMSFGVPERMGT